MGGACAKDREKMTSFTVLICHCQEYKQCIKRCTLYRGAHYIGIAVTYFVRFD